MTLGVWSGFREEISASDSLLLIIDASDYLFIHLSSPLLSFPTSAWSGCPSLKRRATWRVRKENQAQLYFRWWNENHRGHTIFICIKKWGYTQ